MYQDIPAQDGRHAGPSRGCRDGDRRNGRLRRFGGSVGAVDCLATDNSPLSQGITAKGRGRGKPRGRTQTAETFRVDVTPYTQCLELDQDQTSEADHRSRTSDDLDSGTFSSISHRDSSGHPDSSGRVDSSGYRDSSDAYRGSSGHRSSEKTKSASRRHRTPGSSHSNPSSDTVNSATGNVGSAGDLSGIPSGYGTGTFGSATESIAEDDAQEFTTVMLRNIPNKYTREWLLRALHNAGFTGMFDFLYLPIDFENRCNVGYAFINFTSVTARLRFEDLFHGRSVQDCLPGLNSSKIVDVSRAVVQGFKENVARLRGSPIMRQLAEHPDWMPVTVDSEGRHTVLLVPWLVSGKGNGKYRGHKVVLRGLPGSTWAKS